MDNTFDKLQEMFDYFLAIEDKLEREMTADEEKIFDILADWYDVFEDFVQLTDDTIEALHEHGIHDV